MSDANLSNDPIEQHLTVSGLIQNIVRDLGCRTIGDLCELDIKTVESVKGVGVKKVDEFRRLINNARQLAGQTIVINTVPKVDLSGIVFDQSSLLVFVPSILKVAFEQLGVNTVEKLLSLDISAIGNQPGWGEKKKTAAVAIKELYSRLATIQPDAEIELVGDLVPKDVLPADSIGCMLLDKFILGQFRDTLQGKALLEASDLRMLLSRVFRMKSTVVGLNEMEWRDVPLQVGVKVESVAEKYSLTTLGQLADFAMHGRVMDQQTQELLDVTREGNFGESSLTSLREELQRLESMGVTAYRKSIGCSLDDLECADFAWHDVPLRVNKRTRDFLRSQGVEKISEVHKVALRKQVFSKDHNKWLSVSEFPNFSERSIYELRDELSKLNSQGLERYRFGQAGSPKTFKECIDRALSELDSRQIEIVKSRCSGATQGAAGQQYSITRERARQIANSAFKKLKVYRLAAASLVSEYHETLPKCLLWVSERIRNQLHLDETWHLDFLLELAELGHERLNATTISRVPVKCVDLLRTCLRKLTKDDTTFSLQNITAIGEVSHAFKKVFATQESSVLPLEDFADCELITSDIRYKKSIADAAVDGAVPEGNLRSPAQAQSDILAWLQRLESGEELIIQRRPIVVPLNDSGLAAEKRFARYGDFSTMNARWNNANSAKTSERLRATPEEWEQYHTLYRKARENWAVVPYKEFIRWCTSREGYVIADFGCGEGLVAKAVSDRHTVHSFDHLAIDDSVIEGDMTKTSLDSESVDVALFSLSLMGGNFTDYLCEAHRVLKIDGQLHIWEATSRFDDVKRFARSLEQLGFQVFEPKIKDAFVLIEGRKTERKPNPDAELQFRER